MKQKDHNHTFKTSLIYLIVSIIFLSICFVPPIISQRHKEKKRAEREVQEKIDKAKEQYRINQLANDSISSKIISDSIDTINRILRMEQEERLRQAQQKEQEELQRKLPEKQKKYQKTTKSQYEQGYDDGFDCGYDDGNLFQGYMYSAYDEKDLAKFSKEYVKGYRKGYHDGYVDGKEDTDFAWY